MNKKKKFNMWNAIVIAGAIIFSFRVIDYAEKILNLSEFWSLIIGMAIAGILAGTGVFLVGYFSKRLIKKEKINNDIQRY